MAVHHQFLIRISLLFLLCSALVCGQHCIGHPTDEASYMYNATIVLLDEVGDCNTTGQPSSDITAEVKALLDHLNSKSELKVGLKLLPANCHNSNLKFAESILSGVSYESCEKEIQVTRDTPYVPIVAAVLPTQNYLVEYYGMAPAYIPMNIISYSDYSDVEEGFTTGSSLYMRAKAMVKLAVELNWDVAYLYSGNDTVSAYMSEVLRDLATEELICVLHPGDSEFDSPSVTGAFVIDTAHAARSTIELQSTRGHSVWIVTVTDYGSVSTSLDDDSEVTILQVSDVLSKEAKVIAAVEQAFNAFTSVCPSPACYELNALTTMVNGHLQMKSTHSKSLQLLSANSTSRGFTYTSKGAEVGNYFAESGISLTKLTIAQDVMSLCVTDACGHQCRQQFKPRNYIFIPGDYIILYTSPIHQVAAKDDYFKCENFSITASNRAAAVVFAVEQLKKELDLNIGLLAIDTCISIQATLLQLSTALGGTEKFCSRDGCFTIDRLLAVIGDYSSHVTVEEQHILKDLNIVQVAYGAATNILDNKVEFPLFLRTQPSITRLANDAVLLLNELNNKGHVKLDSYVLIHSDSLWGINGGTLLEEKLSGNGYCNVLNRVLTVDQRGQEDLSHYISMLREIRDTDYRNHLIVFHGEEAPLTMILRAIDSNDDLKDWWKAGRFLLLPEIYEGPELIDQFGELLAGTLAFKLDSSDLNVDTFLAELNRKQPDPLDINHWFNKMYQTKFRCKLRGDFSVTHFSTPCKKDSTTNDLELDAYGMFSIINVYATGQGFKKFMTDKKCKVASECIRIARAEPKDLKSDIMYQKINNKDNFNGSDDFRPFNFQGESNIAYIVRSLEASPKETDVKPFDYEYRYVNVYEFVPSEDSASDVLTQPVLTARPTIYTWRDDQHEPITPTYMACASTTSAENNVIPESLSQYAVAAYVLAGVFFLVFVFLAAFAGYIIFKRRQKRRRQPDNIYGQTRISEERDTIRGRELLTPRTRRKLAESRYVEPNGAYTNQGIDLS